MGSRDLSVGNGDLWRPVGQRPILPDPRRGDRRYRAACEQNGVAADRVVGDRRKANDRTHPQVRSGQLPQGWRLVPAAESYADCCGAARRERCATTPISTAPMPMLPRRAVSGGGYGTIIPRSPETG